MTVDREALLRDVMSRAKIEDRARADAVVRAVLGALSEHLTLTDARRIAAGLPSSLGVALDRLGHWAPAHPRTLYVWLATFEEVSVRRAAEHTQAACRALVESVDAEHRDLLARNLPPEWAELFALGAPPPARTDGFRGGEPGFVPALSAAT
jgi:uncharacterized protein (DUF2267 family)